MKTKRYSSTLARRAKITLLLLSTTTIVGLSQAGPAPGSLSELLEKGIYSEETKGDLDAAIQLYQEAAAEAKAGDGLAAQAQYRLGVCYYKKKNFTEASAAFEKLVKDYPDQKELVARAREFLAAAVALLPAPWGDGEEMRLDIKMPTGFKIGMASYTANSGTISGHNIWQLGSRMFAGVQSFSQVEVDADSFKPIHSRWKHQLLGDVDTTYSAGYAELKTKGKEGIRKIALEDIVYDNEEAIQLMRRLPLATNYHTSARVLASLAGGNVIPIALDVTALEKVEVPAGTFECYKVELSIHQTFWYSSDAHHYLVKFEAGGVTAELATIQQLKPGQPVTYRDPAFNFSVIAPAGWIFYHSSAEDNQAKVSLAILDPEAAAETDLTVQAREDLQPEAKKSLRDWAEFKLDKGAKLLKDLKPRPESWNERTLAGQPALSVIADFVQGQEKRTGYLIFSFNKTNAVNLELQVAADDFESFRPKFEAIVDSYRTN